MSYHSGTLADTTAGRLIELLDSVLLLNSYWSIYDAAAGTNAKVYRCYDPDGVVDYYFYVDNNYTNYATIELWEGWNSVTHAGVGAVLKYVSGTTVLRIYFTTDYVIRLNNFNFQMISPSLRAHNFIGRPDELFDETKNIVLAVTKCTNIGSYNPVGSGYNTTTVSCKFLFDENESISNARFRPHVSMIDIAGNGVFSPKICVLNDANKLVVGHITNAASLTDATYSTLAHDDEFTVDGETWKAVKCTAGNLGTSLYRVGN